MTTRTARTATLLLMALLAVVTVALAVHLHYRVERNVRLGQVRQVNDFERWMALFPRLLEERRDYATGSFANPPIALLVLAPLTRLSPARAQLVWACAKAGLAIAIFLLVLGMIRRAGVEVSAAAQAAMVAAWLWPVIGDVQAGQTNLLMLLPLVAGLAVAQRETRGSDWLAGGLIALAVAIKVTPLAFLPYALVRRRFTLALAIVAGLVAWLVLVPALALGWELNLRWLGQWYAGIIEPYVARGEVKYSVGQSLPSLLTRLLRHVPAFVATRGGVETPYYVNLVDLPEPAVAWVIRAGLAAIVVAGLVWARRPLASFRSRRYVLEVGAVAAFMLWASERTWVEHYVTLVLTLGGAGMLASDAAEPEPARRRAWWALGLAAALLVVTSDVAKLLGSDGADWVRTAGVAFWAAVALALALVTARGADPGPGVVAAGRPTA